MPPRFGMSEKSIGRIELTSIAVEFQVADTMLKAGNFRLLLFSRNST
jgi:microcompartment protein CcmL/EutN